MHDNRQIKKGKNRKVRRALLLLLLAVTVVPTVGCSQNRIAQGTEAQETEAQDTEVQDKEVPQTQLQEAQAAESEAGETEVSEAASVQQQDTGGQNQYLEAESLPQPGRRTLANLLMTAKQPVGHTMYVWGGGWNEADTGAGVEAVSIGVSSTWETFAELQDSTYDVKKTTYQIHNGLDCSGYLGWVIYNVFENTDGKDGYVMKAAKMAETFAGYGWGTYTPAEEVTDWKPGDIMSMKGHVWLSLGMCEDGSVVLLHASPPGVRICGTTLADGTKSIAVTLAETYMSKYEPDWYAKYPDCAEEIDYLSKSSRMRWNVQTLTDVGDFEDKSAAEILAYLYDQAEDSR